MASYTDYPQQYQWQQQTAQGTQNPYAFNYAFNTTSIVTNTVTVNNNYYVLTGAGTSQIGNNIFIWQDATQQYAQYVWNVPVNPQPTPEQLQASQRQQEEWAERERVARLELETAERTAQALIEEILDTDAKRQLKEVGYIDVPVTRGRFTDLATMHNYEGRRARFQGAFRFYRIRANSGICLVDREGKESGYLCIHSAHPDGVLPPSDDLLTKWWTAKMNEEQLWTIGNYSRRGGEPVGVAVR